MGMKKLRIFALVLFFVILLLGVGSTRDILEQDEEIQLTPKACDDCGIGTWNICDRTECHRIGAGCYFNSGGVFGFRSCIPCSIMTCDKYQSINDCRADRCGLDYCDCDAENFLRDLSPQTEDESQSDETIPEGVQAGSCKIVNKNECRSNKIVMGLSSITNAHGGLVGQNNYDYVLCCGFAGTQNCSGTNKILGLSSLTNAHAEVPYLGVAGYCSNKNYRCVEYLNKETCPTDTCFWSGRYFNYRCMPRSSADLGTGRCDFLEKETCISHNCKWYMPYIERCWDKREKDSFCFDINSSTECVGESTCKWIEKTLTNYENDVCYGDLECISIRDNCPTDYLIEMLSLSSETNAHIGEFEDYDVKICCSSKTLEEPDQPEDCKLTRAKWYPNRAFEGDKVQLIVNGKNCNGVEISFDVWKYIMTIPSSKKVTKNSLVTKFIGNSAQETWEAELYKDNKESKYFFKAKVVGTSEERNSGVEPNKLLKVTEAPFCANIFSCLDYKNLDACNQDSCDVSKASVDQKKLKGVICGLTHSCECFWNVAEDKCSSKWTAFNTGGEEKCPERTTLCDDGTCSSNCDKTDKGTACNYNSVCEINEGCACKDCNGKPDNCANGLECSLEDKACCNFVSDGYCNEYFCRSVDPDCVGEGEEPTCGNRIIETGEQCDDGNIDNNDGCSSECEYEIIGPGVKCPLGTKLCEDGTCSLNCEFTNKGTSCNWNGTCDEGEGCACADCDGEPDYCADGFECSLDDTACCDFGREKDNICDPYCKFTDPDCKTPPNPITTPGRTIFDDGIFPPIGTCYYNESIFDPCGDDGFMSYSWTVNWEWDGSNICFEGEPSCVETDDGKFHYDPYDPTAGKTESAKCAPGTSIPILCPAKIQIEFFGIYSLVVTILLISFIYGFLIFKENKTGKKLLKTN